LPSTVNHEALLLVLQLQPAPAVTVTVPLLIPSAGALTLVGEIEIEQPLAWLTVNV
jgi:hypothetical protein